jgi:hypothetical protein
MGFQTIINYSLKLKGIYLQSLLFSDCVLLILFFEFL